MLITEELYLYWRLRNKFAAPVVDWKFLAHMSISIAWAVYGAILMTAGFIRRSRLIRYIALAILVLLLAKVFLIDTSAVKSVYRVTAFLATGLTLVAVSYLYQHLKKKGFFETMIGDNRD